jgi:predicted transcriptional regulator
LPEFVGQNRSGVAASPELIAFVADQYASGRSLREIAELTDRTHSAVRNILDRAGVPRRSRGAEPSGDAP